MKDLLLAALWTLAELILVGPRPREPRPEQVCSNLARLRESYFVAFLDRCLASVYPPPAPGVRDR
ncbi:MAG: hypothetical protein HY690_16665 [Chloroflexi bacterium]|nr:hypothetical protein [Chloroflexota bacterium]